MSEENKDFEQEYDSFKDVAEFQNNMFNPGHYIGTGRVPPTVSATGNALPLAVTYFIVAALILAFGLFLFFSDVNVRTLDSIKSPIVNKAIGLIIMSVIAAFCAFFGVVYAKKAKKYYKAKKALKEEPVEEEIEDKLWQRTCPNCNHSHDIDYPKCPNCNYNYIE